MLNNFCEYCHLFGENGCSAYFQEEMPVDCPERYKYPDYSGWVDKED